MADAAGGGEGGSPLVTLILFSLPLLLILWFVMSQRRRARQLAQMQEDLDLGMEVTTTSGLFGTIAFMDDHEVGLAVSDGVVLRFDRRAILTLPPEIAAARAGKGDADDRDASSPEKPGE